MPPLAATLDFHSAGRERHTTARDDFALVGFRRRCDGDEFIRLETRVDAA